MEIQKTVLSVETLVGTATAQAQLESAIPLPNGVRSEKVLSCEPEVSVRETVCAKDSVQVTGLLTLHLTVETEEEKPSAFDAAATFSHTLSVPGAAAQMSARVRAYAPSCTCRVEEGGLRMQTTLLLRGAVFSTDRQECIAGIEDAKGLETQGETVRLDRRTLLGAHSLRVRETVDAPVDAALLRASADADVERLVNGADGVLLEGTLTVSALYAAEDGGVVRQAYAIPFSDAIDAEANPSPCASVEVMQLNADYDADGELRIEAVLSLGLYGTASTEAAVLSDAYDKEGSFSCETKEIPCLTFSGERKHTAVLREPVYVPGHMKDVTRVLYTSATPAVTDTSVGEREASIDGLLLLSIVYRADDGRLYGFKTDLPFSLMLDPMGTLLLPEVSVRSAETTGSGHTLSCTVELKYGGEWYRQENLPLTIDVRPGAPRDPHEGILIYFTDEDDTIFSIGKRFGIAQSCVKQWNPRLSEPIREGVPVLLMRGR